MLIGGNTNPNAGALGSYLLRQAKNEKVALWEIAGTLAENVKAALLEMEAIASGTKCKNFLYHAHIDPRKDEHLTREQFIHAVDVLEKNLGLEGHQRVIVEHVKDGRQHIHIVWNRIDVDTMIAARLSQNYLAHERTKVQLEQEFGLEHVEGVHIDRDGKQRPPRAPRGGEIERGKRSGLDPNAIREEVTQLWQGADSGKAFVAALEASGYLLAKGDQRDFVLIDQAGDAHNLRRRVEGVKLAELRARLSDVEISLTVDQAKDIQAARMHDRAAMDEARALDALHEAAIKKEMVASPLSPQAGRKVHRGYHQPGRFDALKAQHEQVAARQDQAAQLSPEKAGNEKAPAIDEIDGKAPDIISGIPPEIRTTRTLAAVADVGDRLVTDVLGGVCDFLVGTVEKTPEQKQASLEARNEAIRARQKKIITEMQEASRRHIEEREKQDKQQGRTRRDRERERER